MARKKKSTNKGTQTTQNGTDEILKEIYDEIDQLNFKLLKHPRKKEILERQKNKDGTSKCLKDQDSLLGDIKINQRDYKVIATEEVIKKAKEVGYPVIYNKQTVRIYNGKYWDTIDPNDFAQFLERCYLQTQVPMTTAKDATFLKQGYEQFKKAAHLNKKEETGVLLNFKNGTMEFDAAGNFNLREHRQEDFITYMLSFEYDEDADCPRFQQFLDEVVPEKDKQLVLAEFIGSIFSPIKHEKVMLLYGTGHNGKSVFLDCIVALLGSDNICSHTLESLTASSLYFIGDLAEALLNYSGEISTKANPSMFKKLASGEKVTGRRPYGNPFEIENYARLAFNCNKLPEVKEHTDGFFRRFLIIPFEEKISKEDRDLNLAQKIIDKELPGIMNWVLKGLQRLEKKQKFSHCESSERVLSIYRKESDTVGQFLKDKASDFTEPIQSNELYDYYCNYCYNHEFSQLGSKQFAQEITTKGVKKKRKSSGIFYSVHKVDNT